MELRQRYGVASLNIRPHTILPVLDTAPPLRRFRWIRWLLIVAVCAVTVYFRYMPDQTKQRHVTIKTPSDDPRIGLVPSRPILRSEISAGKVDMVPMHVLLQDQEFEMNTYDLTCFCASMMGRPIRLLSMRAADNWEILHFVNPKLTWVSNTEHSSLDERSPLYPNMPPVRVKRAHYAQIQYMNPKTGGEAILKVEGEQAHCIQAAVRQWFKGVTSHTVPQS